jgi:AhpD family alkylhydroperoxidase
MQITVFRTAGVASKKIPAICPIPTVPGIIKVYHIIQNNKYFTMEQRISLLEKGQSALKPMFGLGKYLSRCSIESSLLNLVYFRVSQINGCAFCLDMHSKDLRADGEDEQRLYVLNAWREAPFFSEREQAALAWAEAVTKLDVNQVSDEVYEQAREQFSEEELIDLTLGVNTINSYNRFNIAFRTIAGGYQVGAFDMHSKEASHQ